MKKIYVLSCYIAFVTAAMRHIFKRSVFAINAVIRHIIAVAAAAGIVEAAKIDFYAFAFQDINFTSSKRVVFADLSGWRFVQVAKPFDTLRRLVLA